MCLFDFIYASAHSWDGWGQKILYKNIFLMWQWNFESVPEISLPPCTYGSVAKSCPSLPARPARKFGKSLKNYNFFTYTFLRLNVLKILNNLFLFYYFLSVAEFFRRLCWKVGRVLSFSPIVGIVTPPTPNQQGEGHTRWRERGWGVPIPTRGIHCDILYIYLYFVVLPRVGSTEGKT